jgi:YesN/AraC family two-component response regulator
MIINSILVLGDTMKYYEGDPIIFDSTYIKAVKENNQTYLLNHIEKRYHNAYFDDTKIALFMLLGLLTSALIDQGISKTAMHPFYNDFYNQIHLAKSLDTLKKIELSMNQAFHKRFSDDIIDTDNPLVNQILAYVHMHLEDSISLDTLATSLSYSVSHIKKRFKETMHEPIGHYINRSRIAYSKTLLKMQLSVAEVASLLHFYDTAHYIKTFKKYNPYTPKQYQLGGYNE